MIKPVSSSNEGRVARIRVDYEDGSFDDVQVFPDSTFPLYSLRRRQPDSDTTGAHTNAAVAALLFFTAMKFQRTEYSIEDPKTLELLRFCKTNPKKGARLSLNDPTPRQLVALGIWGIIAALGIYSQWPVIRTMLE